MRMQPHHGMMLCWGSLHTLQTWVQRGCIGAVHLTWERCNSTDLPQNYQLRRVKQVGALVLAHLACVVSGSTQILQRNRAS